MCAIRKTSISMTALNAMTSLFIMLVVRLNEVSTNASDVISILGPLLAIYFVVKTLLWALDCLRPGTLHELLTAGSASKKPRYAPWVVSEFRQRYGRFWQRYANPA